MIYRVQGTKHKDSMSLHAKCTLDDELRIKCPPASLSREVLICNKTKPPSTHAMSWLTLERCSYLVRACACSTLTVQCLWKILICIFS